MKKPGNLKMAGLLWLLFVMTSFIRHVPLISAPCKTSFAQSIKGVEISKWERKKCTRQFALNVERNVKSPSSLTQADLFTAVSAGPRREPQVEDSKSTWPEQEPHSSFFLH